VVVLGTEVEKPEDITILLHRGPLEWYQLPTKFHENLPTGSKVS
jgi:hypothetical protein